MSSDEGFKNVYHFDWRAGVINDEMNPLDLPDGALVDGQDIEIYRGHLRNRGGLSYAKEDAFQFGISYLKQIRFPTNKSSYMIAQGYQSETEVVSASNTQLPSTNMTWTTQASIGAGIDVSVLNDAMVLTHPDERPYAFYGCMASDGSDWTLPITVLYTLDGGLTFGLAPDDILDTDTDTKWDLDGFDTSSYIYIRLPVQYITGLYFEVSPVNGSAATFQLERYTSGAWAAYSSGLSDGTYVSRSLQQSGVITWNLTGSDYTRVSEIPGYWIRVSWSGTLSNVNIVRLLCQCPFQELKITGTEELTFARSFVFYDASRDTYIDWTIQVADYANPTGAYLGYRLGSTLEGMATGDYIYVCGGDEYTGVKIEPLQMGANTTAESVVTSEYWDGDSWASITVVDNTSTPVTQVDTTAAFAVNDGTSAYGDYTIRQVVPAADLAESGYKVRVTLYSTGTEWSIDNMSIVQQSSGGDGTEAPTEITFSSGSGCTVPTSGNISSDWVEYTLTSSNAYIIVMDVSTGSQDVPYEAKSGWTAYYGAASNTYNVQSPGLGSSTADRVYGVCQIEVEQYGAPFAQTGMITWTLPSDWKRRALEDGMYPDGYWIRFHVSADLAVNQYISEVRLQMVQPDMAKYALCETVKDRVCFLNRSDARDQVDITRPLAEYGMEGNDSWSKRIGGLDEIVAAKELFNNLFVAKADAWYVLNGFNTNTFAIERAEGADQCPINNNVLIQGPFSEADDKNKMGVYFINARGAWHMTALQIYKISRNVNWWDETSSNTRLDLDMLGSTAYGCYDPIRNRLMWSVPMVIVSDEGSETDPERNNRIIIYDLNYQAWLPPQDIQANALCNAYHYDVTGPGYRGGVGLYLGDQDGNVSRMFAPGVTADYGQAFNAWAKTGYIHYGNPLVQKTLNTLTVVGKGSIFVTIYVDGKSSGTLKTFDTLTGSNAFYVQSMDVGLRGRFFQYKILISGAGEVHGLIAGVGGMREWGSRA